MTVATGQADGQTMTSELDRRVAEIFHNAGLRSDDVMLRAVAEADPETFAAVRAALEHAEAGELDASEMDEEDEEGQFRNRMACGDSLWDEEQYPEGAAMHCPRHGATSAITEEQWLADHPAEPQDEPEPEDYDPGPECDDQGGMSEYRYAILPLPEGDW